MQAKVIKELELEEVGKAEEMGRSEPTFVQQLLENDSLRV
jgi:hypothetical protein